MTIVTDPELLASLNGGEASQQKSTSVSDPALLSVLNEDPTSSESWYQDPVMAARAALDGMWFGWSDEVGAGVAAAAAQLGGEERTYGEVYGEMLGGLQMERDQYAEDYPVASTMLGVAGSLASPANVLGGKAIMGARNLSAAKKVGTGLAVAGAEGALYGAGAETEGNRSQGAAMGAGIGAATFGALKGVGMAGRGVADTVSKRRIAQDLGKGEDFIPINMAEAPVTAESGKTTGDILPWFYRDVVGKTFGGRGLIEQQSKRWSRPVVESVNRADAHLSKLSNNAKTSIQEMESVVKRRTLESIDAAKTTSKGMAGRIKATGAIEKLGLKEDKLNIPAQKIQKMDAETNAYESFFRQNAYRESLPKGATEKQIAEIVEASPQKAMELTDRLWSDVGFEVTKGKEFRVSPNKVMGDIARIFDEDVLASSTVLASGQPNAIAQFVEQYMAKHVTEGGKMTGEALTQMRSQIGIAANALSDKGGSSANLKGVIGDIQDSVDDVITRQLTEPQQATFLAERKAWAHNRVLRPSVAAASKKAGQKGAFTADDWLANVAKESPRQTRQGQGPLQKQADDVAETVARRDEVLTQAAEQANKANINAQRANIEKQSKRIIREAARLKKELAEIKRKSGAGAAKQRKVLAKESEIAQLTENLDALKAKRDVLLKASPAENVTPFERLFANFLMGGGGVFGAAALPFSIPMANIAGRQTTQRIIAGQNPAQEAIQRQLQKAEGPDLVKRVISREAGAQ